MTFKVDSVVVVSNLAADRIQFAVCAQPTAYSLQAHRLCQMHKKSLIASFRRGSQYVLIASHRVAHDSFVNRLLGLPWQRVIKYHRWCGHITLLVLYLHGGLTWISWLLENSFREEACPEMSIAYSSLLAGHWHPLNGICSIMLI